MRKLLLVIIAICSIGMAQDFYVSPQGSDADSGTKERPVKTLNRAVERVQKYLSVRGYPADGITVYIPGGEYKFDKGIKLGKEFGGDDDRPIIFKSLDNAAPVFNGGIEFDVSGARLMEDNSRLSPQAVGRVYYVNVSLPELKKLLSSSAVKLSCDGRMMMLSRYPNVGYAHIDKIIDKGAVYAQGRTFGDPPSFSMDKPIGGVFTVLEKSTQLWEAEFSRAKKASITGYLSNDWYKESHRIAGIENGNIKLLDYSRYGIEKYGEGKVPRRFFVNNMLCEVDTEGEFYFDETENRFYFIPFRDISAVDKLMIWASDGFITLEGAKNIRFEGLTIEGVGKGNAAVVINNCRNVEFAGCTIRNCATTAVSIEGGQNNGLRSCDIYDVPGHLWLAGGDRKTLTPAGNFAVNCHFTQVQAMDYYGKISVRGVGNIFKNNLVHNFIGQVMTLDGNDHIIEYNELFNIGVEEGDGGAIYSGADMTSWGNVLRYNFLHHLMCIPQTHPRGGIYPDDRDQGETIANNIFYKAAHRAVLINGGAGHTVRDNIFIDGYIGIYNTEAGSESTYNDQSRYDKGELKRGDKTDYIWKTEQIVGKQGWNNEPWLSKYPLFAKIMNQGKMRFWPIECVFTDNRFSGNHQDIEYRFGYQKEQTKSIDEVEWILTEGNKAIDLSVFSGADKMDFRYAAAQTDGLPDVRFDKIGLYKDDYRINPPDKNAYRMAIKEKFAARKSFDENAVYEPSEINGQLYFNTGKLILIDNIKSIPEIYANECVVRNGLPNFFAKAAAGGQVKVAYLGGSITAQPGYRVQTLQAFKQRWPSADFVGIDAAIGGTGSELGAFRVAGDALSHKPDIVFVEFCVNDFGQAVSSPRRVLCSMEGIVRRIIADNADTDICFVYTITESMLNDIKAGNFPMSVIMHEQVAGHYGIPSINMAFDVIRMEREGRLIMKGDEGGVQAVSGQSLDAEIKMPLNESGQVVFSKDGVHPYPNSGHILYSEAVGRSIDKMIAAGRPYSNMLPNAMCPDNLEKAKMLPLSTVKLGGRWSEYNWTDAAISSSIRRYMPELMYSCDTGDYIEFKFKGSAFGLFDIMGPSAGNIICELDGKEFKTVGRFDKYCSYYRMSSFLNYIDNGEHTVKFIVGEPLSIEKKRELIMQRGTDMTDTAMYENNCRYVGKVMLIGELIE